MKPIEANTPNHFLTMGKHGRKHVNKLLLLPLQIFSKYALSIDVSWRRRGRDWHNVFIIVSPSKAARTWQGINKYLLNELTTSWSESWKGSHGIVTWRSSGIRASKSEGKMKTLGAVVAYRTLYFPDYNLLDPHPDRAFRLVFHLVLPSLHSKKYESIGVGKKKKNNYSLIYQQILHLSPDTDPTWILI